MRDPVAIGMVIFLLLGILAYGGIFLKILF